VVIACDEEHDRARVPLGAKRGKIPCSRADRRGLLDLAAALAPGLRRQVRPDRHGRCGDRRGRVHVGVGGGRRALVFKRRHYPLSVGGLSFGATIGASKADSVERAYNLRRRLDTTGIDTAIGEEVATGGAQTIRLQNAKGVVLDVRGRTIGLEFNANVSAAEISLH
jgi:hypothetical protein